MGFVSQRLRNLSGSPDRLFSRRPGLARWLVRYGWVLLLAVGLLLVAGSAVTATGRSQEIIYATQDGSIVSVEPESGETTAIYEGGDGRFATTPATTGGSRSTAFTVLREGDEALRGDLYSTDLVRGTRALTERARPAEVLAYPDFSGDRSWLLAGRFTADSPPNVLLLPASGATKRLLEPASPAGVPVLGPAWTAPNTVYAWRMEANGPVLTAYDFFERRQATVYTSDQRTGRPAYYFDPNALVFDERPRGADPEESRVRILVGTGSLRVSGAEGLGLYDPSPVVPEIGERIAVMWTDGESTGVGLLDPATGRFDKTGVRVEDGSRYPRVSRDGSYVATASPDGSELAIRRLDGGELVRRIRDVQPPETVLTKMRDAGLRVPSEAGWFVPANFSWRSLDG